MNIEHALTMKRPWVDCQIDHNKNIENRKIPFPVEKLGKRIALHGSKLLEDSERHAANSILHRLGIPSYTPASLLALRPSGAIVGTAVLAGWVADKTKVTIPKVWWEAGVKELGRFVVAGDIELSEWVKNPWQVQGQAWWVLRDARPIKTPILISGFLGLWELPENLRSKIQ